MSVCPFEMVEPLNIRKHRMCHQLIFQGSFRGMELTVAVTKCISIPFQILTACETLKISKAQTAYLEEQCDTNIQ